MLNPALWCACVLRSATDFLVLDVDHPANTSALIGYFGAWHREKALSEEKEHVMTVLGEWQHYGRTRNTDYENALKAIQQKEHEIEALQYQVSTLQHRVAWQRYRCCLIGGLS